MIVSALVVTLAPDPNMRALAVDALAHDERLVLGELIGDRLPVVAETSSTADGAALCDALAARAGVVRVDVVAIDFAQEGK
jgi:hypothetical protein